MHWNHRVVNLASVNDGEDFFEVKEVYYNEKNEPVAYADASVCGSNMEELQVEVERFAKALTQPILDAGKDFTGKFEEEEEADN